MARAARRITNGSSDGHYRRARELHFLRERGDDRRVELRPSATLQLGESGFARLPRAVLPVGRHRVVRVGDEDDPRLEGDLLAAQTVRVTRTIPALVVVEDDLGDRIDPETVEHAEPDLRMALEDEALGVRELSRLLEDLLGNCE